MKNKNVKAGEITLIPAGGRYVPAKVLYLSNYFKDLVLIGLYNITVEQIVIPEILPLDFAHLLYTSQQPILKRR